MHHAVWTNVDGLLPILPSPYSYAQSNLKYYNFNCYDPESSFLKVIYPKLVEVKKRGVEVLLIMGDMGSQRIEFTSTDGIHFMGTGLNRSKFTDPVERENSPRDWYIEFKHVPDDKYLSWKFHDLDSTISVNDLAKN